MSHSSSSESRTSHGVRLLLHLKLLGAYLSDPLPSPLVRRHSFMRRDPRLVGFLGRLDLVQAGLVTLIIGISALGTTSTATWFIFIGIVGYVVLVLVHRLLILHSRFREVANTDGAFFTRAIVFTLFNALFLWLIYSHTNYLKTSQEHDALWLLFVFANLSIISRGRIHYLTLTILLAWAALMLTETFQVYLPGTGFEVFFRNWFIKAAWIAVLSAVLYIWLYYLNEELPAYSVVETLSSELAAIQSIPELARTVVTKLKDLFYFDEVNVFLVKSNQLTMIAAASPEACRLVDEKFLLPLNEPSLNRTAFLERKPVKVNNVLTDPIYKNIYYPHAVFTETRSELVIPLLVSDKVIGTLDIMNHSPSAFAPSDENLMKTVAASLGVAMENARNAEQLHAQQRLLQSLQEVVKSLSGMAFSVAQLREVLIQIADAGCQWSGADIVIVYEVAPLAGFGIRSGPYIAGTLTPDTLRPPENPDNLVIRLAYLGRPLFADDVWSPEYSQIFPSPKRSDIGFRERHNIRSLVAVPLWRKVESEMVEHKVSTAEEQQIIGMILFNYKTPQRFENDQERQNLFLTFADLASLAVQRSGLYAKETKLNNERRWQAIHNLFLTQMARIQAMAEESFNNTSPLEWQKTLHRIFDSLLDLRTTGQLDSNFAHSFAGTDLPQRLEALSEELRRGFPHRKIHFDLPSDPKFDDLPTEVGEHLYAIAVEAITNAVRHGHASTIWLQLYWLDNQINLVIENDGPGFDENRVEIRGGLLDMRNRCRLIHGEFSLDSNPDRMGVVVSIVVPAYK